MLRVILSLAMLLASGSLAPAEDVFVSTFEWDEDSNRDGWPDAWQRLLDRQHPHYVRVFLATDAAFEGRRSLKIQLNGGSVAVDSPPVPVQGRFRYTAQAQVRCQGLTRDRFHLVLRCLDDKGRLIAQLRSQAVHGTRPWETVQVAMSGCPPEGTRYLQIRLMLEAAPLADLRGAVWIDQVRLIRRAYLDIRPHPPLGVFARPEQVQLRYSLSGVGYAQGELELVVLDHQGRRVCRPHRVPISGSARTASRGSRQRSPAVVAISRRDSPAGDPRPNHATEGRDSPRRETPTEQQPIRGTWRPPIRQGGYYRVEARLRVAGRVVSRGETSFAVLPPLPVRGEHPFGWSFARPIGPKEQDVWEALVRQLGPKRVKYPLWQTSGTSKTHRETVAWVRRLLSRGAQVVGVCGDPPPPVAKELDGLRLFPEAAVGEVFLMNPKLWAESLGETMLGYGLQVPVWQWGADDDHSLVELQGVARQIAQVRRTLGQSAAFLDVAVPWSLEAPVPTTGAWELVCFSSRKRLPWQQLEQRLEAIRVPSRWWYSLLLDRYRPGGEQAGADPSPTAVQMSMHLLLAHAAGCQGAFLHGVERPGLFLASEGSVGPLAVPWTVTVRSLAGTRHVGNLSLGKGVRNWLFVGPHHAVWVLWAEKPGTQRLPAELVDRAWSLWGKELPRRRFGGGAEVELPVGPEPVFVWSENPALARLARSVRLKHDQVPSVLGQDHPNELIFSNPTDRPLSGEVKLIPPRHWRIAPNRWEFHLAPGESFRKPFLVRLPIYASTGIQQTQVRLHLEGRPVPLVLGLPLQAGIPGLRAQAEVLDQDNQVRVVRVRLHNGRPKRLQVQCTLVLQGLPRRTRTASVPPGQQRVLNFVLDKRVASGSEALLRTYLAEENAFFHLKLRLP